MTDALLPAVRKSMPGKSCVLRKRFALLSLLRVAQTVPSRLVLPLSGSRSASRKTPCQRADNQSICWTLGTSAPTLSFLPPGFSAPIFNHFLKLSITAYCGIRAALFRACGKKNYWGKSHAKAVVLSEQHSIGRYADLR